MEEDRKRYFHVDQRRLTILVFSLFFSWLLAIPFEGQVLYAVAGQYDLSPGTIIFGAIIAHFAGLFLCGFAIRTLLAAKRLIIASILYCTAATAVFFSAPSVLWGIALISASFLAGMCVAAWGCYFKCFTPSNERIKTAADGLIFSNLLMILLNMIAILLSPFAGLSLSLLFLAAGLFFAVRLQVNSPKESSKTTLLSDTAVKYGNVNKPLALLCLFIVIITINSGLMYRVINPAFAHLEWLVSWYWAIPYIIALYVMRNLPKKANRSYILYIGIAMIGFAFIAFMCLDRSAWSYLLIDTLMLGACGIYDLFWWSILGEMLDLGNNPARTLGIGLSSNVLGVLLGGFIGNAIVSSGDMGYQPMILALSVVCVCLVILPLVHKYLSILLKSHAYLAALSEMPAEEQSEAVESFSLTAPLTGRESEITALLLKGKTYKMIAAELHLSENTIKTHIKNIYSKFNIQSRIELMNLFTEKKHSSLKKIEAVKK